MIALRSIISFESFINQERDSLSWYDRLPLDGVSVAPLPGLYSIVQLRERLLASYQPDCCDLELLAAHLLGANELPLPHDPWRKLTAKLSYWMAQELTYNGNRLLRMQLQRLVYYIETLIADAPHLRDLDLIVEEHTHLSAKPWDWLHLKDSTWWIASGSPSIFRTIGDTRQCWNLPLPTQLDVLSDTCLSVGSIYSAGAYLFESGQFKKLVHPKPVLVVFEHKQMRFFLDHDGSLWRDQPREWIMRLPCRQIHFARYWEGRLYCMDNSAYGSITVLDLGMLSASRRATLPVRVCNDIGFGSDGYFLIDKQQGSIYKFDLDFVFQDQALSFGRGYGRLLDPVSIHVDIDSIAVTSWLDDKVTILRYF